MRVGVSDGLKSFLGFEFARIETEAFILYAGQPHQADPAVTGSEAQVERNEKPEAEPAFAG